MSSLWKITSFEDYQENWVSIAGPFNSLSTYYQRWGYKSPEDFFTRNAIAAQEMANDRVGSILERIFSTKDLWPNSQEQLKKFTYRAIDYLRTNDTQVIQQTRENNTIYNNGRNDNSQNLTNSLESIIGGQAWRAWKIANIETLYSSYLKENNIEYILDPSQFYNKDEVNKLLAEIDEAIQLEHSFTEIEVEIVQKDLDEKYIEINKNLDLKQNKVDQVLYTQKTDEFGEPVDNEIHELGTFEALAVLSKNAKSTVITTQNNKRVAVININADLGEVVGAVTQQTSNITDTINPIGRIWGHGVENDIKNVTEDLKVKYKELLELVTSRWIEGEIKSMPIGSVMPKGWIKLDIKNGHTLISGAKTGYSEGRVKMHNHKIDIGLDREVRNEDKGENSLRLVVPNYNTEWGQKGFYLNRGLTSAAGSLFSIKYFPEMTNPSKYNLAAGMYVEFWQYLPKGKRSVNFTMPYHERRLEEERAEQKRKARMASTPTFDDIQPVVEEIEKMKPVVDELFQKENHRMKKLGIDPNDKYWEGESE